MASGGGPDQSSRVSGDWPDPNNHAKFHRARPNGVQEKRYMFYTLHYFGAPEGPIVPKFTNLGGDAYQGLKASSIKLPNFAPF